MGRKLCAERIVGIYPFATSENSSRAVVRSIFSVLRQPLTCSLHPPPAGGAVATRDTQACHGEIPAAPKTKTALAKAKAVFVAGAVGIEPTTRGFGVLKTAFYPALIFIKTHYSIPQKSTSLCKILTLYSTTSSPCPISWFLGKKRTFFRIFLELRTFVNLSLFPFY